MHPARDEDERIDTYITDRLEEAMAVLKYDRTREGRKAYRILLTAVAAEKAEHKSKKGMTRTYMHTYIYV